MPEQAHPAPGALREREHDAQRRAEHEHGEHADARARPGELSERTCHEHKRERCDGADIQQQEQHASRRFEQEGAQTIVGAGQQVIHWRPPDGQKWKKNEP